MNWLYFGIIFFIINTTLLVINYTTISQDNPIYLLGIISSFVGMFCASLLIIISKPKQMGV